MAIKGSGSLTMAEINAEFGLGNNLNAYRNVNWYTDSGGSGTFSSGTVGMAEFYNKRKTVPVFPGSREFPTPGVYNFIVPGYNTLIIEAWGGGAGGGAGQSGGVTGGDGTASVVSNPYGLSMLAQGGAGGQGGYGYRTIGAGGYARAASGGNSVNISGNPGQNYYGRKKGGDAPYGGTGGLGAMTYFNEPGYDGSSPGAGGGGGNQDNGRGYYGHGGGGGSGAFVQSIYTRSTSGAPAFGSTLNISVGYRGEGGVASFGGNGGAGAPGSVKITWY